MSHSHRQALLHSPRKQRKPSPRQTPQERIRSNRRSGKHEVCINEVIETIQKNRKNAKTRRQAGQRRCDPVNVRSKPCPSEPEEAEAETDSADHDGWESPFWDGHVVVCGQFAVVGGGEGDHVGAGEEFAWVCQLASILGLVSEPGIAYRGSCRRRVAAMTSQQYT